jgi:type VI secretion system protein ImpF
MTQSGGTLRATREAHQPSLWDRLVDDLPSLAAEIAGQRQALSSELGPERLDRLVSGGDRALEAEPGLEVHQKARLSRLIKQERRVADLETRGIVVSSDVLREAVRRDIEVLFNTERFESEFMLTDREHGMAPDTPPSLKGYDQVRTSVVNYGVPSFSGRSSRDFDKDSLAREIRDILTVFEPRLRRSSINVSVKTDEKTGLRIDIDALLIMSPAPERLRLRTMIDLDNGRALTALEET